MLKKILILIGLLVFFCSTVVNADDIKIDYDIDFDNSIIKIHCNTEARYNQALSVVLYSGEEMGDDITKIVKIAEVDADENGEADVELKLAESVPSGKYTISVAGGGSIRNFGSVNGFVYKSKDELSQIVDTINNSTQASIKLNFEEYSDIFSLPTDDGVYEQLIKVRNEDYNNKFTTVKEIKDALKASKLLYDLNNIDSEVEILKYIVDNCDALNVDIEDEDFATSKENFATTFKKIKSSKALTGMKSFEKMANEALTISTINSSNAQNMTSAIEKYADVIGISVSQYKSDCAKYGDVEINKALRDKNFESCQSILNAYKNRISELRNSKTGSSGGSSSGHGSKIVSDLGFVPVNTVKEESYFTDFIDISDAEWAKDYIKSSAAKGIVKGYEDNSFKPNKEVTREEFITLIVRAYNSYDANADSSFCDVEDTDWCYSYISSAAKRGYIFGFEDGSFGKGSDITRQDAATILCRVGEANGITFNGGEIDFSDNEKIAEYAKDAIGALNGVGVISGFEDGSFRPTDSLTRAQAVKMIEIMLNFELK